MRILIFIILFSPTLLFAQQPEISFTVEPTTIYLGNSATLKWNIHNADQAYIPNIGKIPLSGSKIISPKSKESPITIIAESSIGIVSKTIIVTVNESPDDSAPGTRGPASLSRGKKDFPAIENFSARRNYTLSAPLSPSPFIDILKHIHNALQDRLGFQVEENYSRHSGKGRFITKPATNRELVKADESSIRQRRIAYLVEINEKPQSAQKFSYSIDAYIEYQRRSENKWRAEKDDSFHINCIQHLHELIRQAVE
jgi:hypothetical protein